MYTSRVNPNPAAGRTSSSSLSYACGSFLDCVKCVCDLSALVHKQSIRPEFVAASNKRGFKHDPTSSYYYYYGGAHLEQQLLVCLRQLHTDVCVCV